MKKTVIISAIVAVVVVTTIVVWAVSPGRSPGTGSTVTPSPTSSQTTSGPAVPSTAGATVPGQTSGGGATVAPDSPTKVPPSSGAGPEVLPGPAQRTAWVPVEEAKQITYRVSTAGPAQVVYGPIGGEQKTVNVTGDWSLNVDVLQEDTTVRVSVTSSSGSAVACEILIDGKSVASRTGLGSPPRAVCAANTLQG